MSEFIETEWSGRHLQKDRIRTMVWSRLQHAQVVQHDPFGHIPNFIDAQQAADRLATLPSWQQASVIKCNPDKPQAPVRLRALQDGKCLYMAVPQLSQPHCFVELRADHLLKQNIPLTQAASMKIALEVGRAVSFQQMQPIDLAIVGCVAVSQSGHRLGKGAGFADLELALLNQFNLLSHKTLIATTVHSLQFVADDEIPIQPHDWALNAIVTPKETIYPQHNHIQPTGIDWNILNPHQLLNIPVLQSLRAHLNS